MPDPRPIVVACAIAGSIPRKRRKLRHMITGRTRLVAHLGYPTEGFKAPLIYNPWFEARGIDAVVVPLGVRSDATPACSAPCSRSPTCTGHWSRCRTRSQPPRWWTS